ncbi:hypothetical protein EVAR_40856_1 [Eumeta japonica]|uniref:Uncharacterized protein n=1 Tax=Eumeta variegata TaxID=151549 RepID=A0A4C1X5Z5_EUMVA|nr:hypothetical protein EVAR_40856_1 [Eumeta japonica]
MQFRVRFLSKWWKGFDSPSTVTRLLVECHPTTSITARFPHISWDIVKKLHKLVEVGSIRGPLLYLYSNRVCKSVESLAAAMWKSRYDYSSTRSTNLSNAFGGHEKTVE